MWLKLNCFTGSILDLISYFCNRRNNFWILGGYVTIDLLKIDFNGWWSLLMVNLRPHKYSWKRSFREFLFQFGQIVSRNHVRDERNILLDGTLGFLITYGFVWGVLLILQNLILNPVDKFGSKIFRMGADATKVFNIPIASNWVFCKLKAFISKSAQSGAVTLVRFGINLRRMFTIPKNLYSSVRDCCASLFAIVFGSVNSVTLWRDYMFQR